MLDEAININLQTNTQLSAVEFSDAAETSDQNLVSSVLSGDTSAFEILFDRYKSPVAHVVGRFFRDRSDIEEFVQQSFAKAYFSLKNFSGSEERSFGAWMTRIAVNVCHDEFRRRQRRPGSLFTEISEDENTYLETVADGRQPSAETSLVAAQLAEKILAGLDAEDRIAVTLVYSQDYSLDEAAEAIGITKSGLKSRLFRCRGTIRAKFGYLFR